MSGTFRSCRRIAHRVRVGLHHMRAGCLQRCGRSESHPGATMPPARANTTASDCAWTPPPLFENHGLGLFATRLRRGRWLVCLPAQVLVEGWCSRAW